MYLKFMTELDFISLARVLPPEVREEDLDWDYENVYEWMYLDLPLIPFSLNVSREHGLADVEDEEISSSDLQTTFPGPLAKPGPVYVFGWNRQENDYADPLPDSLVTYIADRLGVPVQVYAWRVNVDLPDLGPDKIVEPRPSRAS